MRALKHLKEMGKHKCFPSRQIHTIRPAYVKRADEFQTLMNALVPKLKQYTLDCGDVETKVRSDATPEQLKELFRLGPETTEGSSLATLLESIDLTLEHSVRTQHPRFFKQLYAGSEPVGQVAELLTGFLNSAVHVYEVSPVFTTMEKELTRCLVEQLGWNTQTADGVMMNGGTMALMTALITARHWKFPHIRTAGLQASDKPVVFTSEQAHYGVRRACMIAGLGMDNCIAVATDNNGCMIPEALEEAIDKTIRSGSTPFFCSATTGTTVLGGFDDLTELRRICSRHSMWLHSDGAWGGGVLFSNNQRRRESLLAGIDQVDSFNINFHKALSLPQACSFLLTNGHRGALEKSNNSAASYLFQENPNDLGDKTLQCARHVDGLKLWLYWKRYGTQAMGRQIDKAFDNAKYMASILSLQPEKFILVNQPTSANVCFWYIPKAFRKGGAASSECLLVDKESVLANHDLVDKIQRRVRDLVTQSRNMFIQAQPLPGKGYPHFFRQVFIQDTVEHEDVDFILTEIDRVGEDIDLTQL